MHTRSLALGTLLSAALVTGCSAPADTASRGLDEAGAASTPSAAPSATATAPSVAAAAPVRTGPLRVAAVGDSVTEADSPDFSSGDIGQGSWAWAAESPAVDVVGGWAVYGATTEAMAGGVGPTQADVLVVMGGTNDVLQGIPWERSAAALEQVVETTGVTPVVLCTIVPLADDPAATQLFNARLQLLAVQEGWELVDSAAPVRAPDGTWLPGMTEDGIHPTPAAAALIGSAVQQALLD
jgi:GDSL-like lipase/acylhydrolase family protein